MASTYLTRTPGSAPTSSKIATISFWFKLSAINTNFNFFSANQAGLANPASFKILLRDANGRLELQQDDGAAGNDYSLRTNQLLDLIYGKKQRSHPYTHTCHHRNVHTLSWIHRHKLWIQSVYNFIYLWLFFTYICYRTRSCLSLLYN